MSELTVTLMRFALLALLWLFVLAVARVVKRDLYGTRVIPRRVTAPPASASAPSTTPSRAERRRAQQAAKARGNLPTRLVVTDGRAAGTTLPLRESGTLIGRSPECSLVLDDDYASGRHAVIRFDGTDWVVEDLGSTNGTFLGQERLTAPTRVGIGSALRIGRTVVELQR